MQTLKTAAIVILLMTVMYGAYVSLTTPPEPLPEEVHEMLVESPDFDIDTGFPESLGELEDPNSPASGSVAGTNESPGLARSTSDLMAPATQAASRTAVTGSLSDSAITLSETPADEGPSSANAGLGGTEAPTGVSPSSDLLGGERLASRSGPLPKAGPLPKPSGEAADVKIDGDRSYPSTGESFALPDPQSPDSRLPESAEDLPRAISADSEEPAADSIETGDPELGIPAPKRNHYAEEAGQAEDSKQTNLGLVNAIRTADEQYHSGAKQEALATLSLFYDTPKLTPQQRGELLSRLDPLARDVIYSKSHMLEQPRRVRRGESLIEIAAEYDVPWQLLANINGIDDPVTVLPGTDLKVVRGPFRADVDLSESELTLFLGNYYAGRFPVAIGNDPLPQPGTYTVQDKQSAKTYYDASGSPVPPGSPNNPYGAVWLDLGGNVSLHGSPRGDEPTDKGCISLAGDHAKDLYGILSLGSSVVIRE